VTRRLTLAIALASAACSAGGEVANEPTAIALPTAKPVAPPAPPPPTGAVRVLYRDDFFGSVDLVGVDAAHARAVVRLVAQNPERIYIDTIDLASGARIDRWEISDAATKRAIGGRGFPTSDAIRADVLRFASVVAPLGPWHMRQSLPSPTFATSGDRSLVLFGSPPDDGTDGDWLLALGKEGASPKRIDEGVVASYSPVIAPNGRTVAFRGCATSPCDYGLFLAEIAEPGEARHDRPHRVQGVTGSSPPVFDKQGARVLAIGDGVHRSRCLFSALVGARAPADSVFCMKGATDVAFSQDADGRTGVVSGVRGEPGKQAVELVWVLLADGSVLKQNTIDRATGGGILSAAGLFALPMQKGAIAIVDLVGERSVALPEGGGWFFGFDTASFANDTLVLPRKPDGAKGFEIVAIDARAMLAQEGVPRSP
jgi:hypothetical protein